MTSEFDNRKQFVCAECDGVIYRFILRPKRDEFIRLNGGEVINGYDFQKRKTLAERGAVYAGKESAWIPVDDDMQKLDESEAWRVRRHGENDRMWKDRVAKRQEFVKN